MVWWLWILAGAVLLVAEIALPGGFFVIFFGVAAVLVGVLAALDLATAAWLQWLLFSVLSVGSLALLRGPLRERLSPSGEGRAARDYVGEVAVLLEDLPPGQVGKAELRGTSWTVRSHEPRTLERGQRCRVARVEGLTLWVRGEAR